MHPMRRHSGRAPRNDDHANAFASNSYERFRAVWSNNMVVTISSSALVASINGKSLAFTVSGEPTESRVRFCAIRVRSTGV
jgi:hypothetical protein